MARARERLVSLKALEKELADQERGAEQQIDPKELEKLAKLDKVVVEARAVVVAGAVRVEITSRDGTPIWVDGEQVEDGSREVASPTVIEVADHASLRVIPAGTGSASAELTAAENALVVALSSRGVDSYADAVACNAAAKTAAEGVKATKRQIETLCVADPVIGLAAGAAALRAFLSTAEAEDASEDDAIDLAGAEAELTRLSEAERTASGRHSAAVTDLRTVDETARALGVALAGAERDLENARAQSKALSQPKSKIELEADVSEARRVLAERLRDRDAANQAVSGFDVDHLRLRIANLDKAAANASDTRLSVLDRLEALNTEMVAGARSEKQGDFFGKLSRLIQRLESKAKDRRLGFLFPADTATLDYVWLDRLVAILLGGRMAKGGTGGVKVVDFSEVPSDILPLIVGLVARLAFSVQQWLPSGARHPIALFCDEAHLYIPQEVTSGMAENAIAMFERVAKEGRKYGVGLVVISQRPSEVNRTVVSQCSNLVAMRLTNGDDQSVVRRLLPDSLGGFSDLLPVLDTGEALVVGDAILLPTRIRIAKPQNEPLSGTIDFWDKWADASSGSDLNKAVESWRRQSVQK